MGSYNSIELALKNPQDVTELDLMNQKNINFKDLLKFTHLQDLGLMQCGLKEFPLELLSLPELKTLYLDYNQLSSIPNRINQLQNLEFLSLTHNQFSIFPSAILKLNSLKEVNFYSNQISELPENIDLLSQLQRLGIGDNALTTLPVNIINMTQLKELDISKNNINLTSLAPAIKYALKSIKTIDIGNWSDCILALPLIEACIEHVKEIHRKNFPALPPEFKSVEHWKFKNNRAVPLTFNRWLHFDPYFQTLDDYSNEIIQFNFDKQQLVPVELNIAIKEAIEAYTKRPWAEIVVLDVNEEQVREAEDLLLPIVRGMLGEWYQLPYRANQLNFIYVDPKKKLSSNSEYPIIGINIEISLKGKNKFIVEPICFIKYTGFDTYLAHFCAYANDGQVWGNPEMVKQLRKLSRMYGLASVLS